MTSMHNTIEREPEAQVGVTLFKVGGVEYAIAGRMVRSLPTPSPVPSTIDHFGEQIALFDLPELFGVQAASDQQTLILLVERGDHRRAFVIEELTGFEKMDPDQLQPVPELYPPAERRRWDGVMVRPDGALVVVLHPEALADADSGGR